MSKVKNNQVKVENNPVIRVYDNDETLPNS